jgi:hypothetical protein
LKDIITEKLTKEHGFIKLNVDKLKSDEIHRKTAIGSEMDF